MTTFTQEAEQAFTEANTAATGRLATDNQLHKLENMTPRSRTSPRACST